MRSKNRGFTLVEIMIAIAIIGTLIVLTVPTMLRSRMTANEVAAVGSCRTINNGCQAFYANSLPHTYPNGLTDLIAPTSNPSYIDTGLANAVDADNTRQGYYFLFTLTDAEHFTLLAKPKVFGRTGGRNFFVNETGVIRGVTADRDAIEDDPPVE